MGDGHWAMVGDGSALDTTYSTIINAWMICGLVLPADSSVCHLIIRK
jgi:hypothetical protein